MVYIIYCKLVEGLLESQIIQEQETLFYRSSESTSEISLKYRSCYQFLTVGERFEEHFDHLITSRMCTPGGPDYINSSNFLMVDMPF